MEYTHLGRSSLSVSRLCLGTMNFGWKTEEPDSHDLMDRAPAEGVNFFDTANVYGFDAGKGRTEEVLGTWFARGGERREKTVLATKAYEDACREWGHAPADVGLAWLLHRPAVTAPVVGPRTVEQLEGSLRALDVRLDEAQLARLDEIFSGYQAAPMEYAW